MARNSPYLKSLRQLSERERFRSLKETAGLDFSSNDFLGLKQHPYIREKMTEALQSGMDLGSGGSRLLRGNHRAFIELEEAASRFFGAEGCLFMASGFMANFALFSTLPLRGDVILMDELIHASAKEGIRASFAKSAKIRHNDANAYEEAVIQWRRKGAKNIWIAVEAVYSMDGDMAPLIELMDIADRHDCYLVIDEAHATGIQGETGRGLAQEFEGRDNLITLHTCGKALGVSGALIACEQSLVDYMINSSRAFIYTTAPAPVTAVGVKAALDIIEREPHRRRELMELAAYARKKLEALADIQASCTQIIPFILGQDAEAVRISRLLQKAGLDVRAVRPPTVPEGSARLRISITLNISRADIDHLCTILGETKH